MIRCMPFLKRSNSGVCSNSFGSITSYRHADSLAAPKCFSAFPSTVGILSLARQFLVCQSTPDDLLHDRRKSFRISDLSRVEPKYLLVNVSEQVKRFHADVGAIRVDLPIDITLGVIDDLVRVILSQSEVGHDLIGVQMGTSFDIVMNSRYDTLPLGVLNDAGADFTVTLKHSLNCNFPDMTAALTFEQSQLAALVHVPRLATYVRFVNLNLTAQFGKAAILHRQPDSLKHEPSGFLCDTQIAVKLVGTNTVLTTNQQPSRRKPLPKWNRRVLKDCSGLQRERRFRMVRIALPHTSLRKPRYVCRSAHRALNSAIRPAEFGHEPTAVLEIREVQNRILQGGFAFHASSMRLIHWDVKYISATVIL